MCSALQDGSIVAGTQAAQQLRKNPRTPTSADADNAGRLVAGTWLPGRSPEQVARELSTGLTVRNPMQTPGLAGEANATDAQQ